MSILDTSAIRLTELFNTLKVEFGNQHFVLLTAWKRPAPDEHRVADFNARRMEALKSDIAFLGHRATLVPELGRIVRAEYMDLPKEEQGKLSSGQLYETVPFYMVVNSDAERAISFDHDLTDLGVKYEQDFVISWNGTDPSNRYGHVIDISNVKEEYRRSVQNFPHSRLDITP